MNIILDASPLGIGFYHRQAQTGVSRVVEQLVRGLQQANDINLSLAAPTHLAETMRYARTTFGVASPRFVNPPAGRSRAQIENALLKPFGTGSLPSKVIRQGFYRARKAFGSEEARFDTRQWPQESIYHSPFYPIPKSVASNRSVKTVQMIHDLIPIFHPEWFPSGDSTVRAVLETLPPEAYVVTASEATKQDFCQYTKVDPDRVTPIHLAASPALFHPVTDNSAKLAIRTQYGLGDAPYLLSLATFEPRKNTDHLIRCFVRLINSGELATDVKLVLVGTKGWKFDKIMAEIAHHQALRSRIVVTGFVPDQQLAPLYAGALGFLYPSLYEGFGLPPLEAMQCGMPVITSNVASIKEVVGDAAIKVPPTDADALCQAILSITTSETLRSELSEKGLKQASLFSWDKFIAQHVALYKRITSA